MPEATSNQSGPQQAIASFGKYQLCARLGRGGMADVFLAVARGPLGFNKLCVVKCMRGEGESDQVSQDGIGMFLDEARLAARLNHPNVVNTYEVGEIDGTYFIAMEYLEGQSLNHVIDKLRKRQEKIPLPILFRLFEDLLAGLQYAHELTDYDGRPLGLVHRDISPHNLILTYDGHLKLVDFGIAKATSHAARTQTGVLKGKVSYMAPEQAAGEDIDRRADLFAVGLVIWELVAMQRLYAGDAVKVLFKLMNDTAPRLSTVVPDLDPGLDDLVARALARNVDERWASASMMRNRLEEIAKSLSITPARAEQVGEWVSGMFAEPRAEMRERIRAQIKDLEAVPIVPMEQLRRLDASGSHPFRFSEGSTSSSDAFASASSSGSQPVAAVPSPEPRRSRKGAIIAGALLVLGVAAFFVVRSSRSPEAENKPTAGEKSAEPKATATAANTPATITPSVTSAPSVTTALATASTSAEPAQTSKTVAAAPATTKGKTGTAPTTAASQKPSAQPPSAVEDAPGYLTLDTYPWTKVSGAGRVLGTTPLVRVPLPPGTYTLSLVNDEAGVKQSYTVTIKSGETVARSLAFK